MVELDSEDMEQFVEFHTGGNMKARKSTREKLKAWDKLLLLLLVLAGLLAAAAIFIMAIPAVDLIFRLLGLYIEGWERMNQWLLDGERGLRIAITLGLFSVLFLILARFRYNRDNSIYAEAGCPECHEHELIRIRRWRRDRILGYLAVPVRRYACRNCTWQGVRFEGYSPASRVEGLEDEAIDIGADLVKDSEEGMPKVGAIESSEEYLQEVA